MPTQITNIPQGLTVENFLARVAGLGGPAKPCRFAVRIMIRNSGSTQNILNSLPYRPALDNLMYVCDAVEFPGRTFDTTNIRYYGPGQQVPNNTDYGPCNLSLLCNHASLERQFFDDWQQIINPTSSFNYNYPDQYYCDIEIFQFSEYGPPAGLLPMTGIAAPISWTSPEVIYNWRLYKCWPSFVNPQQVTWADNSDVLRLQVTLQYKYWDRPGNDSPILPV